MKVELELLFPVDEEEFFLRELGRHGVIEDDPDVIITASGRTELHAVVWVTATPEALVPVMREFARSHEITFRDDDSPGSRVYVLLVTDAAEITEQLKLAKGITFNRMT